MASSPPVPYSVSLALALKGDGAPSATVYDAALKEARAALRALMVGPELELFSILERNDDLAAASDVAAEFSRDTSEIFVLGIGGSSLGGQALADLVPRGKARVPRVVFVDNPDPVTFPEMLAGCNLKRAFWRFPSRAARRRHWPRCWWRPMQSKRRAAANISSIISPW